MPDAATRIAEELHSLEPGEVYDTDVTIFDNTYTVVATRRDSERAHFFGLFSTPDTSIDVELLANDELLVETQVPEPLGDDERGVIAGHETVWAGEGLPGTVSTQLREAFYTAHSNYVSDVEDPLPF